MCGKYENKLYDGDSGSSLQLHTHTSPGKRYRKFSLYGKFCQNGKFSQNGQLCQNVKFGRNGKMRLGLMKDSERDRSFLLHNDFIVSFV